MPKQTKRKGKAVLSMADFVAMAQQQEPLTQISVARSSSGAGKEIVAFLAHAFSTTNLTEIFLPPIVEKMLAQGQFSKNAFVQAIIDGKAKQKNTRLGSMSTITQPLKDQLLVSPSGKQLTVKRLVPSMEKGVKSTIKTDKADLRDVISFYHGTDGRREGLVAKRIAEPAFLQKSVKTWKLGELRPRTVNPK